MNPEGDIQRQSNPPTVGPGPVGRWALRGLIVLVLVGLALSYVKASRAWMFYSVSESTEVWRYILGGLVGLAISLAFAMVLVLAWLGASWLVWRMYRHFQETYFGATHEEVWNVSAWKLIKATWLVILIVTLWSMQSIPGFLEAQTRSKVSQARGDLRSLNEAIEKYRTENNAYTAAGNDTL